NWQPNGPAGVQVTVGGRPTRASLSLSLHEALKEHAMRLHPFILASALGATLFVASPSIVARDVGADNGIDVTTVNVPAETFVLSNGLTVVVHEDRSSPLVHVNIWYHVGSKNEPAGKSGFAHLFEHLMFNGSENFNDDFFKATQRIGATSQNGTTN